MQNSKLSFKNIKLSTIILGIILLLALVLRLWQLGAVPPSPDWDEVALGYDAYSIIHTGKDEYGKFLPVVLRSFDDYKPALYAYLCIPTVYLFGLTVWAVRLPSVIFGLLAILATFYLVRELFKRDSMALCAVFLMAISPWSLQFSRIGFEANVGDALNIFAALFFVKGLKKPWLFSLSTLSAALSIYVYQSENVFTPLLMLLLVIIYYKDLLKIDKKKIGTALIVGIIAILPMVLYIVTDKEALLRIKGTSIFYQDQFAFLHTQVDLLQAEIAHGDKLGVIFDNRRDVYVKYIIEGYLIHFDPNWLFINGDIPRHHAPGMGLLYLWEFPFILIGIYSLLFHKFDKKTKLLIFGWFLLVPVPASITTELPHAVRTLNFLPIWQIFTTLGLFVTYMYWQKLKYKAIRIALLIIFFGFAFFNFVYYLDQYFVQQNYYYGDQWQYGYQQAVATIKGIQQQYKKIVVSDQAPMDKSYMFFLFYLKYPPAVYQKVGVNSSGNFRAHHAFDKYEFRPIDWNKEDHSPDVLYLGRPQDFPSTVKPLQIIRNPDGTPAMYLVK